MKCGTDEVNERFLDSLKKNNPRAYEDYLQRKKEFENYVISHKREREPVIETPKAPSIITVKIYVSDRTDPQGPAEQQAKDQILGLYNRTINTRNTRLSFAKSSYKLNMDSDFYEELKRKKYLEWKIPTGGMNEYYRIIVMPLIGN
jgi:hypothetical protein